MNAIRLLKEQLSTAHKFLEDTVKDVDEDIAHTAAPGVAHNIAATYGHLVASEDMMLNSVLQGKPTFMSTSWTEKNGMSIPHPEVTQNWSQDYKEWAGSVKVDLNTLREYAKMVYQATEDYISNLREIDLDKEIDLSSMGLGQVSVGWLISNFIIGHTNSIMGEISALKGAQGLKGYPF